MDADKIGKLLVLLSIISFCCTSCVSGFQVQTYTFNIVAAGGGITHSIPIQLKVETLK